MTSGTAGGHKARRLYSVVVFIVLASLDNVAIGLVPPLYSPIAADLGVRESAIGLVTAVSYLFTAVAAVGWAYVGDRSNRKPLLMIGTPAEPHSSRTTQASSPPRRSRRSGWARSPRSGSRWSATSSRPGAAAW
jgi:hypothetical protein